MSNKRGVGVHFDGDLRRALIHEAVAVIAEVGPDALSLREVARRLGVSHAAPAHHFGDRSGLLTAVAAEGFGEPSRSLAAAWSLAHGMAVLRAQGSLGRHHPDVSPAGIEAMGRALIG